MSEAKKVTINNKELKCLICGNNTFEEINKRLNQPRLLIFFSEFSKRPVFSYMCTKCGYIQEFIDKKALI